MTDEGESRIMSSNEKSTKETELDVLKEILRWVKFSGMKEVRGILTSVLDDEQERNVYQLRASPKISSRAFTILSVSVLSWNDTGRRLPA